MKLIFVVMIVTAGLSQSVSAADLTRRIRSCDRQCQHQAGLKQTLEVVRDETIEQSQSGDCPVGGLRLQETGKIQEGGLMSAESILRGLQKDIQKETDLASKDQSRCGTCQQVNLASPVTASRPKSPSPHRSCENRPTETVRGEFESESEALSYIRETLKGNTRDGERLYAACPDPCSFSIYQSQTKISSGKTRVNLVVQCGHPKGGLFATYQFSGAYVHQWSCRP